MTNHSNIRLDSYDLDKITIFEKSIESYLLTETNVVICPSTKNYLCLVIEINSNFTLQEVISLLQIEEDKGNTSFGLIETINRIKKAFFRLNQSLNSSTNIEELSFYFRETSITIKSIYYNSIIDEIEYLVYAIIQHFQYYSTLMGSVPNEIHIPVYEDTATKKFFEKYDAAKMPVFRSHYALFWGLYFDSISKPLIYSLDSTNITPGDLDLSF